MEQGASLKVYVDENAIVQGGSALPVHVVNLVESVVDSGESLLEAGEGDGSIQSKPIKGVGQITLTNGSTEVIGQGTVFEGDAGYLTLSYWYQIFQDGNFYYFDSIEDETHATLSEEWAGETQTIDLLFVGNVASGNGAIALGLENTVSGNSGVAIGYNNIASLGETVAVGSSNESTASAAVALGYANQISAQNSTALGSVNNVSGSYSTAVGVGNVVVGSYATAIGNLLVAPANNEVAVGAFNTNYTPADDSTDRAFVVGNGIDNDTRSNAFVILKNGNADLAGTLQVDGLRIDQIPTSGTITPTHYITISCNGADYKIPVVVA